MSGQTEELQQVEDWANRYPQPSTFEKRNKLSNLAVLKTIKDLEENRIDVLFKWSDSEVVNVDETIKFKVSPLRVHPEPNYEIDGKYKISLSLNAMNQALALRSPPLRLKYFQSIPYQVRGNDISVIDNDNKVVSDMKVDGMVDLRKLIVEDLFKNRTRVQKVARMIPSNKVHDIFRKTNESEEKIALGIVSPSFPLDWKDSDMLDSLQQTFIDFGIEHGVGNSSFSANGTVNSSWTLKGEYFDTKLTGDDEYSVITDLVHEYEQEMTKGLFYSNSSYGVGSLRMGTYTHKLICSNGQYIIHRNSYFNVEHRREETFISNIIKTGFNLPSSVDKIIKDLGVDIPEPRDIGHYLTNYGDLYADLSRNYLIRVISTFKDIDLNLRRAIVTIVEDWRLEINKLCELFKLKDKKPDMIKEIAMRDPTIALDPKGVELGDKTIYPTSKAKIIDVFSAAGNYYGIGTAFGNSLSVMSGRVLNMKEALTPTITLEQYNRVV